MYHLINHPLIKDKLSWMRKKDTPSIIFRSALTELTKLLSYEATKNFSVIDIEIETPLTKTKAFNIENDIVIVPILRAGLAMSSALMDLMPNSSVGFIGLYRDEEKLLPVKYYQKLPPLTTGANVLICDPMIATANSIIKAIEIVQEYNPKSITVIGIVASSLGLAKLETKFPNIPVYIAAKDEDLNDIGYIVPGLGDAGDRIFKTK